MPAPRKTRTKQNQSKNAVVVLCAEEAIRDVLAYWYASTPAQVMVAANGYEANRLLAKNGCALLVTDRILPPWPGLDNFIELSSDHPDLKIAYVDDGTPDARILARVTGADVILPRPLTRRNVIAALPRGARA